MTTITSKFTKERLIDWAVVAVAERGRDLKDAPESVEAAANLKLAEIALAALTAEPVAYNQVQRDMMKDIIVRKMGGNLAGEKLVMDDIHAVTMALIDAGFRTAPPVQETGVYKDMLNIIGLLEKNEWAEHCTNTVLGSLLESEITRLVSKEQQAPERERIRRKHAEWSDKTFGDVGPVGPLKHLSKEALEAAADPSDPLEWADMQFLLWDAQRRMGISDEFITRAMIEKLEINKTRQWPEPKDGEPRLHIKELPESVVPEECPAELPYAQVKEVADLFALCWQSGEVVTYTPDPEKAIIWLNNYSGTCVQEYVKLERLQEALAGNSPVTPDGYALVPVEPTDEMIVAAMDSDDVTYNESDDTVFYVHHREIYKAMLAAAPKPETGPCTK
ncbi:DUF550 domain-containing protein [Salmonella enterica subsp. enterica serovar Typhimurium]|uniref:DUF550 domain-containing protein n=6 Tax=Salmonella enterica TaxID=28901 RepID=A0A5X2DSY0_SALTM|nr:DUF550 domain-containing protein [Salmonella enterica subsp. enterica serovar Typhimurium]EAT0447343.1 DUF550 domain-containing protein [Salmonella enterica]EBH8169925.1 DUF550 domain-containing protein [Salmonella enterica subsp. enterica serovar Typhimurium str. UK-1]ECM1862384.1 DUF550 domain-containing protein [Salmonella enterica subsp. enterica serovar Newport]EDT8859737.1 DUF550 domain-containing protein [Salmonella enterica subsp. enterica serovar Agbeni]EDW2137083.1 DUF550 domain-c